jgi:hypothetical protein
VTSCNSGKAGHAFFGALLFEAFSLLPLPLFLIKIQKNNKLSSLFQFPTNWSFLKDFIKGDFKPAFDDFTAQNCKP